MEAVEAIVRLSLFSKETTFNLIWTWCMDEWGMYLTDEDLEAMWAKRVRVM